jgi:imidazoleglycerol phosphate dehydratase HisB
MNRWHKWPLISGRAYFVWKASLSRPVAIAHRTRPTFFQIVVRHLGAAINIKVTGENTHHMIEACFKGVGRALRQAFRIEGTELPSSKGVL